MLRSVGKDAECCSVSFRMVYDGIPDEQAGDTKKTGGETPLPAVLSDALADCVFHVENPNIIMSGHAVSYKLFITLTTVTGVIKLIHNDNIICLKQNANNNRT